jgi:hypothetical protein
MRAPTDLLEFSDDITEDDVEPLRAFLGSRLGQLVLRYEDGTDAHFTAQALAELAGADALQLTDMVYRWETAVAAGLTEQSGPVQTLRQDVGLRWNQLCKIAQRFNGDHDYNPNWRPLRYLCADHADHAAFVEAAAAAAATADGA